MDERIDKAVVSVGKNEELEREEKRYWSRTAYEEKLRTITYLRECFYGLEATTGRLQRVHSVLERE
jgi:hypothetical protein